IPRAVGRPRHVEHMPDVNQFGDGLATLVFRVTLVVLAVTDPINIEKETVQMHCVRRNGRIDHSPMNGLAGLVRYALVKWPCFAVYGRDFHAVRGKEVLAPQAKNKNPVVRLRSRWIDDERAGKHGLRKFASVQGMVRSCRPVHVSSGFARDELRFSRFTGCDAYCVLRISGMAMESINLDGPR